MCLYFVLGNSTHLLTVYSSLALKLLKTPFVYILCVSMQNMIIYYALYYEA